MGKKEAHKEQFLTDVMNNVPQRAKDQPTISILPIKPVNSVVPKPRALIDFKLEKKPESKPEYNPQSTFLCSDSEPEEEDKLSDIEYLKAAFRYHYRKMLEYNAIMTHMKMKLQKTGKSFSMFHATVCFHSSGCI